MINAEMIEGLPEDQRLATRMAIMTLAQIGVIELEIAHRESELVNGDAQEDVLILAERIKEHRLITQQLEELQQLGKKYGEES